MKARQGRECQPAAARASQANGRHAGARCRDNVRAGALQRREDDAGPDEELGIEIRTRSGTALVLPAGLQPGLVLVRSYQLFDDFLKSSVPTSDK